MRLAPMVLVVGLVVSRFALPHPARYMLGMALVCFAGVLLSQGTSALTAACSSLLPRLPQGGLLALWLTAAPLRLASDSIHASPRLASERRRHAFALERTNHERAEARDEAEEARRLKLQFAATIGHEPRTPLSLILGLAEWAHKMPEL